MVFGRTSLRRSLSRIGKHAPYITIFAFAAIGHLLGAFNFIDRAVMDTSFRTFDRAPSGQLVVVEFDPNTLRQLDVWPWPRSVHAQTIEKLLKAGVLEIGYDVDFSSPSTPAEDAVLGAALSDAQTRIILPAFRQRASVSDGSIISYETAPLPAFRESVQLGSVSFRPSADGLIRTMSVTTPWTGKAIPAMSALLAGPASTQLGEFYMDFGIDVDAIPRVSLIDVLQNRVADEIFTGKKVLVGAGATELGDQHAVPIHNRMFGVDVQALAFESMVQGRALTMIRPSIIVATLALLTFLIGARLETFRWQASAALGVTAIAALAGASIVIQGLTTAIAPVGALIVLTGAIVIYSAYRDLWALATLSFRQRMNLLHQRAFIQEILDNSFDGVIVTDTDGRIIAHNESATRLLGKPSATLIGMAFDELLPPGEAFRITAVGHNPNKRQEDGKPVTVVRFDEEGAPSVYLEFSRGQFARTLSRFSQVERRTKERIFFTYTFRNVSERVMREIDQRRDVEQAIEETRAKSEVMATMSHELRTPLNAILGFSEIMKMGTLGPLSDAYANYADNIHSSGRHLLALIDDMLDVACVDSGRFVLNDRPMNVVGVLEQCMRIAEGMADSRHRTITLQIKDDLPQLLADQRLIVQCLINLITNSIKYTSDGDRITIVARLDARGDLIIEVEDTGMGVSAENLELIRKPFYRVESAETAKGSVGLGLSLVDAYVRAHDGRVEISSQLHVGTTVRMIFPRARIVAPLQEVEANPAADSPPDNIVDFKRS